MDQAGWHTTGALTLPKNLSLLFLPPKSPELNPVENIWQYLRQTWLANRDFDTYDAILDAGCKPGTDICQATPRFTCRRGLRLKAIKPGSSMLVAQDMLFSLAAGISDIGLRKAGCNPLVVVK